MAELLSAGRPGSPLTDNYNPISAETRSGRETRRAYFCQQLPLQDHQRPNRNERSEGTHLLRYSTSTPTARTETHLSVCVCRFYLRYQFTTSSTTDSMFLSSERTFEHDKLRPSTSTSLSYQDDVKLQNVCTPIQLKALQSWNNLITKTDITTFKLL